MLFNSFEFAFFLPIVFLLYWFISRGNYKFQNLIILIASYFFYACWDWRFLFLLIFSTLLDYSTGIKMQDARTKEKKQFWFWLSVSVNLGFLCVFKYFNFFVDSFAKSLSLLNVTVNLWTLKVILPVGISFYTFHGLSYVIDIYKNRIKAERNFVSYSVFVCFFPLLVAGPIERATHLLPQILKKREFDYFKAIDGLRQILWGLFKKIVVADNCASLANHIFDSYHLQSGSMLFMGAFFFSFQIYGDFSGYSDIAIGTAKLFGIDLLRNFAFPYFSRDIAEFWRRWHISLTTWFRDYLYIPLGGSRGSKWQVIRNTFIIFVVSGFWHGANWTFLAWGAFHAMLFLPLLVLQKNRKNTNIIAENKLFPSFKELYQMFFTFLAVLFGWILFRAQSIDQALDYISRIFSVTIFTPVCFSVQVMGAIAWISILIIVEWFQRTKKHGLEITNMKSQFLRYGIYVSIIALILWSSGKSETFIYFQF